MARRPIAVTLNRFAGQQSTGVYEAEGGIPVVITDVPYLAGDLSLHQPMPVFDAGGTVFLDDSGKAQAALPVSGLGDTPVQNLTWDANTPWDENTYWS